MSLALASPEARFAYLRSDHLPGIEISRVHHSGLVPPWQLISAVRLVLMTDGYASVGLGKASTVVGRGEIWVNGPEENPRVLSRPPPASSVITQLTAATFEALTALPADSIEPQVLQAPELAEALSVLAAGIEQAQPAEALREARRQVGRLFAAALAEGRGRKLRPGGLRPEVAQVRRILRQRFMETVSLQELTELCGLSKFHLLRVFQDAFGLPPHAYQLRVRVARAREMLERSLSAAQVALECGFSDQAHFNRCFKRIVGLTPGAFRRLD